MGIGYGIWIFEPGIPPVHKLNGAYGTAGDAETRVRGDKGEKRQG
jgi:hypothetical protein